MSPQVCLKLLAMKAEVNVKSEGNKTPLLWAMVKDLPEVFLALIQHGATLSVEGNGGRNPLVYAIEKGLHGAVPTMLESSTVEANAPGIGGKTPLRAAAEKGFTEVPSLVKNALLQTHAPALSWVNRTLTGLCSV